jgi:hypothetical protein
MEHAPLGQPTIDGSAVASGMLSPDSIKARTLLGFPVCFHVYTLAIFPTNIHTYIVYNIIVLNAF